MTSARVVIVAVLVAVAGSATASPHRRHRERKHHRARAAASTPFALASPSPDSPAPATALPTRFDPPEAPPPALVAPPPATVAAPTPTRPARRDDVGRQRRWGLFGGGLAVFLGGYALDIGLSYGLGHSPAATSLIPIAGPLVQMGDSWAMVAPSATGNPQVDGPANERIASVNHTIQTAAYAVLAVDCALQLAGVTMAVVGVVGRAPRNYAARPGTRVAWSLRHDGVAVYF